MTALNKPLTYFYTAYTASKKSYEIVGSALKEAIKSDPQLESAAKARFAELAALEPLAVADYHNDALFLMSRKNT